MASYKIQIPDWHPASLNTLKGHWSVSHKAKKLDREIVAIYSRGIPKATTKRIVCLTIYLGYKQRGCDPDNYAKSLLDALKQAGMLVDDSHKWCEFAPVKYDRHGDRQKETIIELIDV